MHAAILVKDYSVRRNMNGFNNYLYEG